MTQRIAVKVMARILGPGSAWDETSPRQRNLAVRASHVRLNGKWFAAYVRRVLGRQP